MKQFILLALIACLAFSCSDKYDAEQQHIDDMAEIEAYMAENGFTGYSQTDSGVFYKILEEGEDGNDYPNENSTVRCDYIGNILDDELTIFDSGINSEFNLNNVIQGWQDGMVKLKRGGSGVFFIPSTLAYGNRRVGNTIGKDEILQFHVTLDHFWN